MSKEELSSRLRDLGNGMYGLANDAAYIIQELEEVKAYRDELEETRRIMVGAAQADKAMIDRLRAERDEATNELAREVPRIITAEELQEGQTVAIRAHAESDWSAGTVESLPKRGVVWLEEVGIGLHPTESAIILLADAPPQEPDPEPARRGRVVEPEELREGDVYDLWDSLDRCRKGLTTSTLPYTAGDFYGTDEIRLISRKPPEPEENPVILVHRAVETYEEPVPAYRLSDNAWITPDRGKSFYADTLQDWSPARVVPAGQEGE